MGNVLAIGDIHTKIWIIERVAKVMHDYDKVIFCGDYADDFNASPQDTINTCYEVSPEVWCIDTFSTTPDGTPIGDG